MNRLVLALGVVAAPAMAQEVVSYPYPGSFDDAAFSVETAIVGQGLVIDSVSHVGEMLKRTGADVGSDKEIFVAAEVYNFCSAVISRQVMEADPLNLGYCPYGIFVAETADGVTVGHRTYPEGEMKAVEALLATITQEAVAQ